jgi:hypothetical protein
MASSGAPASETPGIVSGGSPGPYQQAKKPVRGHQRHRGVAMQCFDQGGW